MRHKHYDIIVAWAEGRTIQVLDEGSWSDTPHPSFCERHGYRIKPEPKPDRVEVRSVAGWNYMIALAGEVRCTFDGETGLLKSVELIK